MRISTLLLIIGALFIVAILLLPGCAAPARVDTRPTPTHSDVPDCVPGASGEHTRTAFNPAVHIIPDSWFNFSKPLWLRAAGER